MDYALIFLVGIGAGFIAAIIGGAGIVTLPALMLVGLSPQLVIATTKFASVGFWIATLFKFSKSRRIAWSFVLPLCVIGMAGSFIGTKIAIGVPANVMQLIAAVGILASIPLLLKKDMFEKTQSHGTVHRVLGYVAYFIVAVYGGFLGAAQGVLTSLVFVGFFGLTITESRATDGFPRILMAMASLTAFTLNELLDLRYGFTLMGGMILGGWLGAHAAEKKGDKWVKRVFITATVLMSFYLAWESISDIGSH